MIVVVCEHFGTALLRVTDNHDILSQLLYYIWAKSYLFLSFLCIEVIRVYCKNTSDGN